MSNGIGKDMHFRCHIQNAHNVNMSMGQKMLYRISKAPFGFGTKGTFTECAASQGALFI